MESALGRLQRFLWPQGNTALPETITNTTWSPFFDGYEPIHALVAERAGQLLGLVHFLFHRTTIPPTSNCCMEDLFTIQAARGQGVGRPLIEEVYRRAKQAGSAEVYWQTQETNASAMKLYDKVAQKSGFLVIERLGDETFTLLMPR